MEAITTSLCYPPNMLSSSPSLSHFCTSNSVMGRALSMAEPVILKWNPETTTNASVTSLFRHDRREAMQFIQSVINLHSAMYHHTPLTDQLSRASNLMQIAMKRLQKEFYLILSMNRTQLDPESLSTRSSSPSSVSTSDEADSPIGDASILADLRVIAECMISSGYAKECVKVYKLIRKSIVDGGIYRLGVERFSSSRIRKLDWHVLELMIQNWLCAVRTAVKILFNGERILCDHVFASSDSVRELCFSEITKEGAMILFGFPEIVARDGLRSPEGIFRALDMYAGISELQPEIDSIFSFQSTIQIKSQALTSLIKLGEFTRAALKDFESTVLKSSTKSQIPGSGGIHQLTIDAMNYLSVLADYRNHLSDILPDSPPSGLYHLPPQSYLGISESDDSPASAITLKMAWIILALLCKLDAKAKNYKDVSLSYLFLANNLQYVVVKVRSSNLKFILGEGWVMKHEKKAKQYAENYQRIGWSHVIESISSDRTADETYEKVKGKFNNFNTLFDQAYRKQCHYVVPDNEIRDFIKSCIARKIILPYRDFYNTHKPNLERERTLASAVKFTPENLEHRLSNMFFEDLESGVLRHFSRLHTS